MDRLENAMKETAADRYLGKLESDGAGMTDYANTDLISRVCRLVGDQSAISSGKSGPSGRHPDCRPRHEVAGGHRSAPSLCKTTMSS